MYTAYDVVFESSNEKKESFFCNLCNFVLISHQDFLYSEEFNCCNECYLSFVESKIQLWKDGWRPDKTAVEAYTYKRKQIILGE